MSKFNNNYKILYEGQIYNTFKELCEAAGVNYSSAKSYRQKHQEIDDLTVIEHFKETKIKYYKNIPYKTLPELCKKLGINHAKVSGRIYTCGWTLDEAISAGNQNKNCREIIHDGVTYKSVKEAAKATGISESAFKSRLARGRDYLFDQNSHSNNIPIEHDGIIYNSRNELAKATKIPANTIRRRQLINNMSISDAVSYGADNRRKMKVELNGQTYSSLTKACKANNLTYYAVLYRIREMNMSLQECYDLKNMDFSNRSVIYKGKKFETTKEACEELDLSYSKIKTIINRYNLTPEEAIEIGIKRRKRIPSLLQVLIELELQRRMIPYEVEYYFTDLEDKGYLKFDIALTINNKKALIEADGSVHFYRSFKNKNGDYYEKLVLTRYRDLLKNAYCEKNNIPLLRIRLDQTQDIPQLINDFISAPTKYSNNYLNDIYLNNEYYNYGLLFTPKYIDFLKNATHEQVEASIKRIIGTDDCKEYFVPSTDNFKGRVILLKEKLQ